MKLIVKHEQKTPVINRGSNTYFLMSRSLSDLGVRREGKTGLSPKKRNFEANGGSL